MSENPRGSVARYYRGVAPGSIVRRVKDEPDQIFALGELPDGVLSGLALEGAILLHLRGAAWDDIVSGKAIPDRALPAGRDAHAPARDAIAAVLADELYDQMKEGRGRLSPPEIRELRTQALAQAKDRVASMSAEQIKEARRHPDVRSRLSRAEPPRSLSALLATNAAAPDPSDEFAAAAD